MLSKLTQQSAPPLYFLIINGRRVSYQFHIHRVGRVVPGTGKKRTPMSVCVRVGDDDGVNVSSTRSLLNGTGADPSSPDIVKQLPAELSTSQS